MQIEKMFYFIICLLLYLYFYDEIDNYLFYLFFFLQEIIIECLILRVVDINLIYMIDKYGLEDRFCNSNKIVFKKIYIY